MPIITTYRTIRSLAVAEDQVQIGAKLAEFISDCRNVFGIDIIEIQTIAGRIYVRLSDRLPTRNDGAADPAYFELEPMDM